MKCWTKIGSRSWDYRKLDPLELLSASVSRIAPNYIWLGNLVVLAGEHL